MLQYDVRGLQISGASSEALACFERALEAHLSWHGDTEAPLNLALQLAPEFTMAHVLRAYAHIGSRDPRRVAQARVGYEAALRLPSTERERAHLQVVGDVLADDFIAARSLLKRLLDEHPLDVLALQFSNAIDYLTGDLRAMNTQLACVRPYWSPTIVGFHNVLAMQAFGYAESGRYIEAAELGHQALTLVPGDVRAHHALTHLYEMAGEFADGAAWMQRRREHWAHAGGSTTHLWWHWALFRLGDHDIPAALEIYDRRIRRDCSGQLADLIDASALLWRVELMGGAAGLRWQELARAWQVHADDGYCTFSDMHAMAAFVGAADWRGARRLEQALQRSQSHATRYGETTRLIGLPVARALMAFGLGYFGPAAQVLRQLPRSAHRMGGSHAQRNLMLLTLQEAERRQRRAKSPDWGVTHRHLQVAHSASNTCVA